MHLTDLWAVRASFAPLNVGFVQVCFDDDAVWHMLWDLAAREKTY